MTDNASGATAVAWQWRYACGTAWCTPSGGAKLTDEQLKREGPIEQRPLYAIPDAAQARIRVLEEALRSAQQALASSRHLQLKYIPAHDWLPHLNEDIERVKAALSAHTPRDGKNTLPPDWKQDQAETSRLPRKDTP